MARRLLDRPPSFAPAAGASYSAARASLSFSKRRGGSSAGLYSLGIQRSATHAPVAIERAARRRTNCRSPKDAARPLEQQRATPKLSTRT
eukprot:4678339-Pyramimonas_sp.AAC.1